MGAEETHRRPCSASEGKKRVCWAREGSEWCGNHDPALAAARRANGAKRVAPRAKKPPNWRKEWRDPRPSRAEVDELRLSRAREVFDEPLPEKEALRDEAMRTLRSIALSPFASEGPRVSACGALLKATEPPAPGKEEPSVFQPTQHQSLAEALDA